LKILVSSIACAPYSGSEGLYGWLACRAIARDHEIHILTHTTCREQIERADREGLIPKQMHFYYVGRPHISHPNRLLARLQSWLIYRTFQKEVLDQARQLCREQSFDVIHHLTFTTWRVASPLWRLGLPFVWGPISGTEQMPVRFWKILSPSALAFEALRRLSDLCSTYSPAIRDCARKSSAIIAIHSQARQKLVRLRGRDEGISTFSGFFFLDERVTRLRGPRDFFTGDRPLRIFASGNLEGRKGVALVLRALALVKQRGIPFHYRVTSHGPELNHLKKLARHLKLEDCVSLGAPFSGEEYFQALRTFDISLLPSLREGGGLSTMEAMLAGCVPIVADCGGPGDAVTNECGYKIPVTTPQQMTLDIANAIITLHEEPEKFSRLGPAASERIADLYSEQRFRNHIDAVYAELSH